MRITINLNANLRPSDKFILKKWVGLWAVPKFKV